MSTKARKRLLEALAKIDRPGSFCVSGSAPAVLPGLEVEGVGPVGLPLTVKQAKELKKHCEQAPYGKGEETIVDTSVRRVWRLTPDRFALKGPAWDGLLAQMVKQVQEGLGLESQKLEPHLYDLLLYEPGSFFLPHRDGEKLERMVATLVVVLPSAFEGGELVVRHEGQEQVTDLGGGDLFNVHFTAFYADCEHEVRALRKGYRLCLVYNLTLKKAKKAVGAPRTAEHVEQVSQALREWAGAEGGPHKLVVTLEHQYTQDGLKWDALKGADRAKADALFAAAQKMGCHAYLALLTFHEHGSAEGGGGYGYRRRRWYEEDEEDEGPYEMGEVFESSLALDHWSAPDGKRPPFGEMNVEEDEVLDPEAIEAVDPEEEFEGYTGNAGMTLDRWYRHGAVVLWRNRDHFEVLCDAGTHRAVDSLKEMVAQWQRSGKKGAEARKADCVTFARAILARWPEDPYGRSRREGLGPSPFVQALEALDEPGLFEAYVTQVLARDAAAEPGLALARAGNKHGWAPLRPGLEAVFAKTTTATFERNVRLLESICTTRPRGKEEWLDLCAALSRSALAGLEAIDAAAANDWQAREVKRGKVLPELARALLATEQVDLLSRLVDHALARPDRYPLTAVHVSALTALRPWLEKNVKKPVAPLARWVAAVREQLEALTAQAPQAPTDFRRAATVSCNCRDCAELKRFLEDPKEQTHRFPRIEAGRQHLEENIRRAACDLTLRTERVGRPYTLVCTKNTASYKGQVKKYEQDQEHLAAIRALEARLPK